MRRPAYEFIILPILTIIIGYMLYIFFSYSIYHTNWGGILKVATPTPLQ